MASPQWCTITDVLDQAPELRNDVELGTIGFDEYSRYIERGTLNTRQSVQNRYDLTNLPVAPDTLPLSLRTMAAIDTALLMILARQVGEAGAKREAYLRAEKAKWTTQAVLGSLLDDANGVIASSGGIDTNSNSNPSPTAVEDVYSYGARYGVTDESMANNLERGGL